MCHVFFCVCACVQGGGRRRGGSIHLIPFLWSNAGIMDAGCSDIRATSSWRTSWMFSSCRQRRAKSNRWEKEEEGQQDKRSDVEGGVRRGWGLQRSRWYSGTRIDVIVTEEYILFSPLLCHSSCCHGANADSHARSFKWTMTPAHKLKCTFCSLSPPFSLPPSASLGQKLLPHAWSEGSWGCSAAHPPSRPGPGTKQKNMASLTNNNKKK